MVSHIHLKLGTGVDHEYKYKVKMSRSQGHIMYSVKSFNNSLLGGPMKFILGGGGNMKTTPPN